MLVPAAGRRTRIVVLNGASSSGKTSIARAFQRVHQWLAYDLRIDTSVTAPDDAARDIVAGLP